MINVHTATSGDLSAEVLFNEKSGKFHVVLRDLDAGMTLPVVNIYASKEAAIAYANTLVD